MVIKFLNKYIALCSDKFYCILVLYCNPLISLSLRERGYNNNWSECLECAVTLSLTFFSVTERVLKLAYVYISTNEKSLESPEMPRKYIRKFQICLNPEREGFENFKRLLEFSNWGHLHTILNLFRTL